MTGERDEQIMPARVTREAGEALGEQATLQVGAKLLLDVAGRPPS
jgi:hypothetical protein